MWEKLQNLDKGNQGRTIPYSLIRRLNIVNMSILINLIYTFTAIPVKPQQVILWMLIA